MSKKRNKIKWMRFAFILSMLFYPVLHFLVFTIYVNFKTIVYSFQRWNAYTGNVDWVNFENYRDVIETIRTQLPYHSAVINTFLWIPLNLFVLIPVSVIVAYILSRKIKFHNFYRFVYFFPAILSIVIITMVFSFMVSPTIGAVNPFLGWLGLEYLQHSWLGETATALGTVFFFCIWAGIGFNSVIILGAISRIPAEIFEVGKLEGITRWKELFRVVIPMIWPTISTLVIIGTSSSFAIFLQSKLLTNGGPNYSTNTVALQILNLVSTGDYGLASAFGIMLAIAGFAVTWVIKRLLDQNQTVEY